MWKFVLLIAVFMIGIFTVVTNLTAKRIGGHAVNPIEFLTGGSRSRVRTPDPVPDEMSHIIARIEAAAPALLKRLRKPKTVFEPREVSGEDLSDHELPAAVFNAASARRTNFTRALLDGATFEGADADGALFRRARLASAVLDAGTFAGADFSGAILRAGRARAATLTGARFDDADVSFVSFSGARLEGARFARAYATGALMIDADLRKADFSGATLTGVRFVRADLTGAQFGAARVDKTEFDGAILRGADLSGVLSAEPGQFAKACADKATRLPAGQTAPPC